MIALVGKNNAIAMSQKSYKSGQHKLFTAGSSMAAGLMAMEYLLNTASDNTTIDKDILNIYVPDTLKGFAGKAYVEYIRTGKTAGGRAFTDEEKQLINKVALLLCSKGLNIKATESKYMTKDLSDFRSAVINLAKELKVDAPSQAQSQAPSQAKSPVVAKLEELMTKALEEGDFDTYDKLEERLNKLTGQQAQPQAPVVDEEPEEEPVEEEQVELNVDEEIADLDC